MAIKPPLGRLLRKRRSFPRGSSMNPISTPPREGVSARDIVRVAVAAFLVQRTQGGIPISADRAVDAARQIVAAGCFVCQDPEVHYAGIFVPDEATQRALGVEKLRQRHMMYVLCEAHHPETPGLQDAIEQLAASPSNTVL